MAILEVDKHGRNTLPETVCRTLGIGEGGATFVLLNKTTRGTYELLPAAAVPRDQIWAHHPEMKCRTGEAEVDFLEGRTTNTSTIEEAQAHLDRLKGKPPGQCSCRRTDPRQLSIYAEDL